MTDQPIIPQSDLQAISERKSLRGEEFFQSITESIKCAMERSLKTNKVIYVVSGKGGFCVHSHGVSLTDFPEIITKYKKGERL